MRILRSIVASETLLMRAGQRKLPKCRAVGAQLIGYQQLRRESLFLEQLAHQPQRCALVAAALNQHVEDLALVVDGATDTFACWRSAPSRRDAIGRSAAAGAAAACGRSKDQISAPSAAPSRRKCPAHARRVDPQRSGGQGSMNDGSAFLSPASVPGVAHPAVDVLVNNAGGVAE